jgi:hypothetical protein
MPDLHRLAVCELSDGGSEQGAPRNHRARASGGKTRCILIEILVPARDNEGHPFAAKTYKTIRDELT